MKKTILIILVAFNGMLFAQQGTPSKIAEATVYRNQASLTRLAKATVKTGKNEVILTGISTDIDPASLQVKFFGDKTTLLSAKYEQNYLIKQPENTKVTSLKDQVKKVSNELEWNAITQKSLKGMLAILDKNQDLGGANGSFNASQVVALANSYKTKYLAIQKELFEVVKKQVSLNDKKAKLSKQLQELNGRYNKPSGSIILKLDSKISGIVNIMLHYTVRNAGWNPSYDLRSNSIKEDVKLSYKAKIYQRTGQDWENVALSVSTGNPTQNNNRPILKPLFAYVYQDSPVSYESDNLEEVVVSPTTNMALKKRESSYKSGYSYNAQVAQNQLNVSFGIAGKNTILSDGKENAFALKQYKLKTTYQYHTVPKLSKVAFLLAKITDWSQYNLVAGTANIFFEGAYVGKTRINPNTTADELLISLGRDNGIVVEREPVKAYTATKLIGSNKKETFAYTISIKNKKHTAINIEILDQIPVSQDKSIMVTLEDKSNASYDEKIGKLLWEIDLAPGESKTVSFKYTIKYPKKAQIQGKK